MACNLASGFTDAESSLLEDLQNLSRFVKSVARVSRADPTGPGQENWADSDIRQ